MSFVIVFIQRPLVANVDIVHLTQHSYIFIPGAVLLTLNPFSLYRPEVNNPTLWSFCFNSDISSILRARVSAGSRDARKTKTPHLGVGGKQNPVVLTSPPAASHTLMTTFLMLLSHSAHTHLVNHVCVCVCSWILGFRESQTKMVICIFLKVVPQTVLEEQSVSQCYDLTSPSIEAHS